MKISTVGLIGSGNIGTVVARLSIAAGYNVVLANSRGPASLADLVAELGPNAQAATPAEAAAIGDLVVVTVPLKAYLDIPIEPLVGKIVIDTNNYYPDRDGVIEAIDDGSRTTSELLQERIVGASVVKAFNNIFFSALEALAEPTDVEQRSTLPVFGDDAEAVAAVTQYLHTIGYDSLEAGSLADSWQAENGKPAYVYPYSVDRDVNRFQRVDGETVARLLSDAVRDQGKPRTVNSLR